MKYEKILNEIFSCVESLLENSQPSYTDTNGRTQLQLFTTSDTGKNFSQKAPKALEEKNPKRVEGGKKSVETRKINQRNEFVSRPIFQALNYNPEENS